MGRANQDADSLVPSWMGEEQLDSGGQVLINHYHTVCVLEEGKEEGEEEEELVID